MVDYNNQKKLRSRSFEGLSAIDGSDDVYTEQLIPSNKIIGGGKTSPHNGSLSSGSEIDLDGHDMSSVSRLSSQLSMPTPPDGGWGWVIVIAAFFIHLIGEGIMVSFGVLFVELTDSFSSDSKSAISLIGAFSYCIPALLAPVSSSLINSFGCRPVCILGGFISGMGCFLSYFTNSIATLILTLGFITGCGQSLCLTASLVIVASYFSDRRAFAMGLSISGMGVGTVVFAPVINVLLAYYTWRGTMLILAGLYFNLMVCGAFLRPIEDKLAQRKRKLLAHIEYFSRQSGLDVTRNEDYRASDVDRKIEILKEALTSPEDIPPSAVVSSQTTVDKDVECKIMIEEAPIIPKGDVIRQRKISPQPSDRSTSDTDEDVDEVLNNLRQNFINISYVRDFMPFSENYRICVAEPDLPTILEDEILEIPSQDVLAAAETGSILGHSSHDIFGACVDLSNPISEEELSSVRSLRSLRSLSRSGDLDRSIVSLNTSLKKLPEERHSKSLGNILLNDTQDSPYDPGWISEVPMKVNSDPELERSRLLLSKHLDDILHTPLVPKRPPRIATPNLQLDNPRQIEREEVRRARSLWKKRHRLHRHKISNSHENTLAAVVAEERAVHLYEAFGNPESPFKRPDIFYRGSLNRMSSFDNKMSMSMPMLKTPRYSTGSNCCSLCCRTGNRLIKNMLDFSVLLQSHYALFFFSNVILLMWSMMALFYLGHWAVACGIDENRAALLFAIMGVTNTFGQIIVGWLGDREGTDILLLYIILTGLSGLATCIVPLLQDFLFLALYAGIFGFTIAGSDSLCSVIVVEFLGVQRLTNGIGVVLCGQGIAFMLGPPLLGLIVDLPNGYSLGFLISGVLVVLSSFLLLPVVFHQYCRRHRQNHPSNPFHSSKTVITSLPINGDHAETPSLV